MTDHRAIIYAGEASEPVRTGGTVLVTAPSPAAAARLAADLVDGGVDTIELCGATGLPWSAAVEAAVAGRARVGAVLFGFESLTQVARYKERAVAGEALTALFLHVREGADPAVDRLERREGGSRVLFVAIPDAGAGAAVAAGLADEVQLVELYGGFAPHEAAAVIEAVGERVPVGVAVHARAPGPAPAV
ncbi:DUF6506 family protein [Streptomyces sp. NPDC014894]|uniref:DUF6506 family protein n=1 Tax=unclassified Streptomyces TaxID=2593676 RepID=UPI0037018E68